MREVGCAACSRRLSRGVRRTRCSSCRKDARQARPDPRGVPLNEHAQGALVACAGCDGSRQGIWASSLCALACAWALRCRIFLARQPLGWIYFSVNLRSGSRIFYINVLLRGRTVYYRYRLTSAILCINESPCQSSYPFVPNCSLFKPGALCLNSDCSLHALVAVYTHSDAHIGC